jgi:hypothetical protein
LNEREVVLKKTLVQAALGHLVLVIQIYEFRKLENQPVAVAIVGVAQSLVVLANQFLRHFNMLPVGPVSNIIGVAPQHECKPTGAHF